MWTQNVSVGYTRKYQSNLKTLGKYIYIYIDTHTNTWKPKTWMLGFYPQRYAFISKKCRSA